MIPFPSTRSRSHIEFFAELIEWMLSIAPSYTNATNHDGRTPLHLAAALGHLETCRLLVEKGAHKDALMLSKV